MGICEESRNERVRMQTIARCLSIFATWSRWAFFGFLVACSPSIGPTSNPPVGASSIAASTELLYVANAQGDSVTVYGRADAAPIRVITQDVFNPLAIAIDRRDNLFVANAEVNVYSLGDTKVTRTIVNGIDGPQALAIDKSGDLYVANFPIPVGGCPCGSVSVYSPGGRKLLRTIPADGPQALALDSSDDLYVANAFSNDVRVYGPNSTRPLRSIRNGIDGPSALAFDNSGNLYVANSAYVAVYAPGSDAPTRTIRQGVHSPIALAVDSSGTLYVGNVGSVTEYASGKSNVLLRIDEGSAAASSFAFDSSGNAYVATLRTGVGSTPNGAVSVYAPGHTIPSRVIVNGVDDPHAIAFGH